MLCGLHGRKGQWSCEGTVLTYAGRGKRHQLLSGRLPFRSFAGLTHLISLLQNEMVGSACYSLALWQTLNWDHRFQGCPERLSLLKGCRFAAHACAVHSPTPKLFLLGLSFCARASKRGVRMCTGMLEKIQQEKPQERTKNLEYRPKSEFFLTEQKQLYNQKHGELG